ncbi:MAG: efflux RND transporter permease subunit [Pseudomonadota bacterium]|nr:efflux RND transporter permease subunit [Pseudomonadota bacterium]
MGFTDTFINRPVFAWVLSLILLLLGLMSFNLLPIRQFPEISITTVTVVTSYPGASAEIMEGFVTAPIESAVAGVNGIDFINSSNTKGTSVVTINFKLGTDVNAAASDISDRVNSVRYRLPREVFDPIIQKQDPNANPIMYISFASKQLPEVEISEYLRRIIKPRLETLPGVGEAKIFGERNYAMRIWLNPGFMASHNVSPSDVIQSLRASNFQSPSGRLSTGLQEYDVTANTDLSTADQFNNIIVRNENGNLTRIQDVGKAQLGAYNPRASVAMNGKPAIVIGIVTRGDANPLEVATEVRGSLNALAKHLPKDMQIEIVWDSTKFISASIYEVKKTIIEATLCVMIVMFLFLGSLRMLTIPLVTIPLSLIGICSLMLLMGYSLNTITFLAMVIAIGLVVDDAIVVSENIHRHVEMGKTPLQAALVATREIKMAVIAMTLTLAAVFAPLGFRGGLTGSLFKEFAFTLAGTVIVSGFIALTLSPMMCSRIINHKTLEGPFAKKVDHIFTGLAQRYRQLLTRVLNFRRYYLLLIIPVSLLITVLLGWYLINTQKIAPQEDAGAILTIVQGPAGSNLAFTEKYTQQMAEILNKVPEKTTLGIINGMMGVNSAIAFLILKPWEERTRSVGEVINSLFPQLSSITGVNAFPVNPYSLPGSGELQPVGFVIQTTGDYDELYRVSQAMLKKAQAYPGLANVSSDLKIDKPDFRVNINRDLVAHLGVSMQDIGDAINFSFNESAVSQFTLQGQSYDVIPQLLEEFRQTPESIEKIYVRTITQNLIPLANIITIDRATIPQSLNHYQQMRSAQITASLAPGYTQAQAVDFFQDTANEMLPQNMRYDFASESRQFISESSGFIVILGFAIIFIMLILAAQFESFIDPLIVMIAVPLSITGAFLLLIPFGGEVSFLHKFDAYQYGGVFAVLGSFIQNSGSLNIYTWIGILTLIGLVSKHGILIVEFANQLRAQHKTINEAVIIAASIRLRPILMTTGAIVLGAIPLVLASGAGAISRKEIGLVIIGGMLYGTLMSLFVVPIFYTLLSPYKKAVPAIAETAESEAKPIG